MNIHEVNMVNGLSVHVYVNIFNMKLTDSRWLC